MSMHQTVMNFNKYYSLNRLKEVLEQLPHIQVLSIKIVKLERKSSLFKVDYAPEFIGNSDTGLIHGGIITTLLDSVGGAAVYSVLSEGVSLATLDLRLDYLRQATPGLAVMASAEAYHQTRNVVFVRGSAYHHQPDEPIANFVASYMVGSVGFSPNA